MPGIEEILTASWRIYPSWFLLFGGVWLSLRGLALHRSVPVELRDPHRALQIARSFRIGIAGLCMIGWAVGWLWSTGWIVVVSFIILGEEMLETSTMIAALRDGVAREERGRSLRFSDVAIPRERGRSLRFSDVAIPRGKLDEWRRGQEGNRNI